MNDLYEIELARLTNLDTIAATFAPREKKESLAVQTQTVKDYITASNENLEDFQETATRINSDIRPRVTEIHLKRCEESGIVQCICFEKPTPYNALQEVSIL